MEINYSLSKQQDSTCGTGCFGIGDSKVRRGPDDVTDSFLASELNELSVKERELICEDLHGVAPIIEETPELLQEAFTELTATLANTPKRQRRAYDRAVLLKPSLEKDTKFKMMFLRADQYDAVKAAQRMCNYFTNKLELFGEEKLVKKITLDDLNDDDMAAVNTGAVHMLPRKDSARRAVWFFAPPYYEYKHWRNQIRYIWYSLMMGLEDEDAQFHGFVYVIYCVDMVSTEQNHTQVARAGPLLMAVPCRMAGMHFCYNNALLRPALSFLQMVIGKHTRLRFRIHFGSNVECQYALLTFGIPTGCIPIRSDGSLKTEVNKRYLAERRYKEAEWQKEEDSCSTILYPSPKDILLGRGRPYQEYSGNQTLAQTIELRREQYQLTTDRFDKTCLSLDVVKTIQESGGRFLERILERGWKEVDDTAARGKVSQLFRTKPTRQMKLVEVPLKADGPSSNKRLRYDESFLRSKHVADGV